MTGYSGPKSGQSRHHQDNVQVLDFKMPRIFESTDRGISLNSQPFFNFKLLFLILDFSLKCFKGLFLGVSNFFNCYPILLIRLRRFRICFQNGSSVIRSRASILLIIGGKFYSQSGRPI